MALSLEELAKRGGVSVQEALQLCREWQQRSNPPGASFAPPEGAVATVSPTATPTGTQANPVEVKDDEEDVKEEDVKEEEEEETRSSPRTKRSRNVEDDAGKEEAKRARTTSNEGKASNNGYECNPEEVESGIKKEERLYGDRLLLSRQHKGGIARLGGGPVESFPSPRPGHPRFQDLGDFEVACYAGLWQPDGPQFAGQLTAAVDGIPPRARSDDTPPFAVFIKRSLNKSKWLGWEYCGQYKAADSGNTSGTVGFVMSNLTEEGDVIEDGEPAVYLKACNIADSTKGKIMDGILNSNCWGKETLNYWRKRLTRAISVDSSEVAPASVAERREPTQDVPFPSLAARARALGFNETMSDRDLAKLIMEIDEYHRLVTIEFVGYDERVYDYVKAGCTNKGPDGKSAVSGNVAKASDWYAYLDQN